METDCFAANLYLETYYDERFRFGITVSGYDTSLPADEIESILRKHFASCGEMTRVFVNTLDDIAYIYFVDQEGEDKALQGDGISEVGGWRIEATPVAKAEPKPNMDIPPPRGRQRKSRFSYCNPAHCIMMADETHEKIMAFKRKRGLV
ncbi:unnamed protein product [Thlaspi arvense]|uniref:Uncharacterized protein n=1 Tax=Thlaspi arvense TaxID=13288 RepID=A0AAU9RX34_THLAR|nr:unnamed protein product [Thlaspi arvense]